jgi:ferredoxin
LEAFKAMSKEIIVFTKKIPSVPSVPETREDFCIGCGTCVRVCPVKDVNELVKEEVLPGVEAAIGEIPRSKREKMVSVDHGDTCTLAEFCIKCRRCVEECPVDARTFQTT